MNAEQPTPTPNETPKTETSQTETPQAETPKTDNKNRKNIIAGIVVVLIVIALMNLCSDGNKDKWQHGWTEFVGNSCYVASKEVFKSKEGQKSHILFGISDYSGLAVPFLTVDNDEVGLSDDNITITNSGYSHTLKFMNSERLRLQGKGDTVHTIWAQSSDLAYEIFKEFGNSSTSFTVSGEWGTAHFETDGRFKQCIYKHVYPKKEYGDVFNKR